MTRSRRGDLSPGGSRFYDGEGWGWQQLWLTATEVLATASREYGIDATSATLLSDGYLNQSWRLSVPDGDKVLRVSRTERTLDHARYEDRLVAAWILTIPEVVAPASMHHPLINGHVITLYPYLTGRSGVEVDPVVRAGQIAPLMARMHRVSLDLDLPQRPGARSVDHDLPSERRSPVRKAVIDRFGTSRDVMDPVGQLDAYVAELDAFVRSLRAGGPLDRSDEDLLLPFARLQAVGELDWLTDEKGHATHLALGNLRNIAADLTGPPVRG